MYNISLLNHVENFYDCPCISFVEIFISACVLELLSSVLSFHVAGLPWALQGKFSGNKYPQLLFIKKCINFSLTFVGQF